KPRKIVQPIDPVRPPVRPIRPIRPVIPNPRPPRIISPPPVALPPARPPVRPPVVPVVTPEFLSDEVLVSVELTAPQTVEAAVAAAFNLEILERQTNALVGVRFVRFRIPDRRNLASVIAALAADPRISQPQPNYIYSKSGDPQLLSDDAYVLQYALAKLGARDAHVLAQGRGAVVAVIDSGIDARHTDLNGRVTETLDTVSSDPRFGGAQPLGDSHGTAIAGIIAARGLSNGIAPSATLLNARAFATGLAGDTLAATTMRILKSLDWAIRQNARVVNMSFVGPRDGYVGRAVLKAIETGAILVAAAGNNGPTARPAYPAAYRNVIAVTATDANDALYEKANRGSYVAVAAPGVDVFTTAINGRHQVQSGTSFAAAYVSGVIALCL
ncbi:MAG: S8 family serine peptidase, partial [Pseudomonadota bacterium]